MKKKCNTCGDEAVCWLLSPCPDCLEGKRIKRITEKITKNLKDNKVKREKRKKSGKKKKGLDIYAENKQPSFTGHN